VYGKAPAALSGVAFIYSHFGVAASAIHAKITAGALPYACKKYLIIAGNAFRYSVQC